MIFAKLTDTKGATVAHQILPLKLNLDLSYGNYKLLWEKVHYSAMIQINFLMGAVIALLEEGPPQKDDPQQFAKDLHTALIKKVYPDLSLEEASRYVSRVLQKTTDKYDYETIMEIVSRTRPDLNLSGRHDLVSRALADAMRPDNYAMRNTYIIAEIIEDQFGKSERARYIEAVISGKAL